MTRTSKILRELVILSALALLMVGCVQMDRNWAVTCDGKRVTTVRAQFVDPPDDAGCVAFRFHTGEQAQRVCGCVVTLERP